MNNEEEERAVLERALLRLASLEDTALPDALHRLLPKVLPLLRRAGVIRTAALELVRLISKRASAYSPKPMPMPLKELVLCFCDPNSIPELDGQFALLFIDGVTSQLSVDDKTPDLWISVAAPLLSQFAMRTEEHQTLIFHIVLSLLPGFSKLERTTNVDSSKSSEEKMKFLLDRYNISMSLFDQETFLRAGLDFLLYPYASPKKKADEAENKEAEQEVPPGLSLKGVKLVTRNGKISWNFASLSKAKLEFINFLRCGIFEVTVIYPHILVCAVDSSDTVTAAAEDGFRRMGKPNLDEHPKLISTMFEVYLGGSQNDADSLRKKPCSELLKVRIIKEFLRSTQCTKSSASCFKVLLDSLVGEHNYLKLRSSGVQFLQWVLLHGEANDTKKFAPLFLKHLLKMLKDHSEKDDQMEFRGLIYEPLAQLCALVPDVVNKSIQVPMFFFKRFKSESAMNKSSVENGIRVLCSAFTSLSPAMDSQMKSFLLTLLQNEDPESEPLIPKEKILILFWLNQIFPFSDSEVRLICCQYAAEEHPEVKDAASKGLLARVVKNQSGMVSLQPFPVFSEFISLLYSRERHDASSINPAYFRECLLFAKKCFSFALRQGKQENLTVESISLYVRMLLDCFNSNLFEKVALGSLQVSASELLLDVCASSLEVSAQLITFEFARSFLSHQNGEIRDNFAGIVSKIASLLDQSSFGSFIQDLLNTLEDESIVNGLNKSLVHGTLHCLGSAIDTQSSRFDRSFIARSTSVLVQLLGSSNAGVSSSSCVCLSRVFVNFGLSFESGEHVKYQFTASQAVARLFRLAKNSKENEVGVNAFNTLSSFCKSIASGSQVANSVEVVELVIGGLLQFTSLRDSEVSLSCGEAIAQVCAIKGLEVGGNAESKTSEDVFSFMWKKLVMEEFPNASKIVRSNLAVWLLVLSFRLGSTIDSLGFASHLQEVFCSLLKDSKQVTQEAASKGLMFLYDNSSPDTKLNLSKSFLFLPGKMAASLASSSSSGGNSTDEKDKEKEDTEQRISTYGELTQIAQDFNQPGLIYYFLDLACTSPLWLGAVGSKFSKKSIDKICEIVIPRLVSLFPKLYRYQYHPSPFVKVSACCYFRLLMFCRQS
jgi:hypothetical protein